MGFYEFNMTAPHTNLEKNQDKVEWHQVVPTQYENRIYFQIITVHYTEKGPPSDWVVPDLFQSTLSSLISILLWAYTRKWNVGGRQFIRFIMATQKSFSIPSCELYPLVDRHNIRLCLHNFNVITYTSKSNFGWIMNI